MTPQTDDHKARQQARSEAITALLAKIGYVPTVGLGS